MCRPDVWVLRMSISLESVVNPVAPVPTHTLAHLLCVWAGHDPSAVNAQHVAAYTKQSFGLQTTLLYVIHFCFSGDVLTSFFPFSSGKGGKNRRRGKNENESEKRELVFKEDGQGKAHSSHSRQNPPATHLYVVVIYLKRDEVNTPRAELSHTVQPRHRSSLSLGRDGVDKQGKVQPYRKTSSYKDSSSVEFSIGSFKAGVASCEPSDLLSVSGSDPDVIHMGLRIGWSTSQIRIGIWS